MLSNGHGGFGGRAGETHREQSRQGAPARPNNLCRATEDVVRAHRADLHEPEQEPDPTTNTEPSVETVAMVPIAQLPDSLTATRTRERHALIQELAGQGMTITAMSQHLGLDRKTVRKYRDADSPESLINGRRSRARSFEEFVPYLRHRVRNDHVTNAVQLFAELQARGYRGSRRTVRRYMEPLRAAVTTPALPPAPPTVREVTRLITSHPERLTEEETTQLKAILARSPQLTKLAEHVTAFAKMMMERTGAKGLKPWLTAVLTDDIPQLRSFARGIERDLDAVTNGLSLPYSSGAVEGNVTRVKALKRGRYGRANLDLLRKIILCSPC